MRYRTALASVTLFLACSTRAVTEPDAAIGQWGGTTASMAISRSGASLTFQCGAARIDSTWTLTRDGDFEGTGARFAGGGPEPITGRPPIPARFTGRLSGDTFTLTVFPADPTSSWALGPFRMNRDGPNIIQLCL